MASIRHLIACALILVLGTIGQPAFSADTPDSLQNQINATTSDLSDLDFSIKNYQDKLTEEQQELVEAEQTLKDSNDELARLQAAYERKATSELERQIADVDYTIKLAERSVASSKKSIDRSERKLAEVKGERKALEDKLASLKQKAVDIQNQKAKAAAEAAAKAKARAEAERKKKEQEALAKAKAEAMAEARRRAQLEAETAAKAKVAAAKPAPVEVSQQAPAPVAKAATPAEKTQAAALPAPAKVTPDQVKAEKTPAKTVASPAPAKPATTEKTEPVEEAVATIVEARMPVKAVQKAATQTAKPDADCQNLPSSATTTTKQMTALDRQLKAYASGEVNRLKRLVGNNINARQSVPGGQNLRLEGSMLKPCSAEQVQALSFVHLGENQYRLETRVVAGEQEFWVGDLLKVTRKIPEQDNGELYVFFLDLGKINLPRLAGYKKSLLPL